MGNWRTVRIVGTCEAADVPALRKALVMDLDNLDSFHCLMNGGICGLPNWAAERIDVVGNLAERDYGPEAVAKTLTELKAVAPSLRVKVHCGGDYEDSACVATVSMDAVSVGPPEIPDVGAVAPGQLMDNMLALMRGHRR